LPFRLGGALTCYIVLRKWRNEVPQYFDERIYRRFTGQAEELLDVRGVMRNQGGSPRFEIALVLVRFDHVASVIVNAYHGIM
jgi:hypothetical protein